MSSVSSPLQVLAVVGATWYSGLLGQALDSWSVHYNRLQAEKVRVAAIRLDSQERAFRTVCPDYFDMIWPSRQISTLRWCNDYRDRF